MTGKPEVGELWFWDGMSKEVMLLLQVHNIYEDLSGVVQEFVCFNLTLGAQEVISFGEGNWGHWRFLS